MVNNQGTPTTPQGSTDIDIPALFKRLGLDTEQSVSGTYNGQWVQSSSGSTIESYNPSTGSLLAKVQVPSTQDVESTIAAAKAAQIQLRKMPAPQRGHILRDIRTALAEHVDDLGMIITLEMGKIKSEGRGEVVEFLDVADIALGLSRQIGGVVLPSERNKHFMGEVANPLGVIGVISAFNFPIAVFGWNFSLAFICGNASIWKPAETTPLCAIATTRIITSVLEKHGLPGALCSLLVGGGDIGAKIVADPRVDLISFTGSEARGKDVGVECAKQFKQTILELGGNNAGIVMADANLQLALRNIVFSALGTCGQRCTSNRRLFVQRSVIDSFTSSLVSAYESASKRIGLPHQDTTLIGPLHHANSIKSYLSAIEDVKSQGGKVLFGGRLLEESEYSDKNMKGGNWILPTICRFDTSEGIDIMKKETFAPILYVVPFDTLEEAIELNNCVAQGLSSVLYTQDISSMFQWIGAEGSDCGIINVNGSTSGAEVGGRFGGNKSTGWGRESGGDAWKQYCRWSSVTINWSNEVGLAQGVTFD
ncbi:hypothetical protein QFC24_004553 [Naganishia onofrii]|uniref:Uncharacterized protein n=1 Tax=Naganishia onofrii TaxID=1851511 RepID=A0ACC2XED4_9TREE|nr:hypothetical protein QFC24_004553 [Naganishia onofrii]